MVFVDASPIQFCKLKVSLPKGSASMASEWIGLAIEEMVKESDFEVLSENPVYILPQMFFSAKSLLVSCMLEQSFDNIRLNSL